MRPTNLVGKVTFLNLSTTANHVGLSDKRSRIVGNKRGFSSMDKQKQKEIASKGGKAAHQKGTAHEFTSEEARIAGRKGGAASRARRASAGADTSAAEQQEPSESEPTGSSESPENP
jgi:hypothetical protein